MAMRISRKLHRQLLAMAAASREAEVCGLIVGGVDIDTIVSATNVAANPANSFEIDPVMLFAAVRAERAGGARVLGYYHSHPIGPPTPSQRDAELAKPDGKVWIIIGKGRVTAWCMNQLKQFNEIELIITD
jgi:desampylase